MVDETGEVRLLVVGDGPVTEALLAMAGVLGWPARSAAVLPDATGALPDADVVVVTSHDDGVDAPAIAAALTLDRQYVGAMGSRARQARRRQWMTENGVTGEQLSRLHAPAGLDIRADSPGEIAVAILAEVVAVLHDAPDTRSVSDRDGPIHPGQPPGTAYSPPG